MPPTDYPIKSLVSYHVNRQLDVWLLLLHC